MIRLDLTLVDSNLDEERLQELTRDLCHTIQSETDGESSMAEESGNIGDKGDIVSLGTIITTFLTSGAAVALFNVFKAYFDRHKSLEIVLQREDGQKLVINAQNTNNNQIDRTLAIAEEFMGGGNG